MSGPLQAKPTSIAKALAKLTASPVPKLSSDLRRLSLSLATRNAHYGARHFLKEDLPRIAYANPSVEFSVTRKPHPKDDPWKPELGIEFADGTTKMIDMTQKHSSVILKELLLAAGAPKEATA